MVRYSQDDDAFLLPDSVDGSSSSQEVDGVSNRRSLSVARLLNSSPSSSSSLNSDDDKGSNSYATFSRPAYVTSRPYARVAGASIADNSGGDTVVGDSTSNKDTVSTQTGRLRYVEVVL